MKLYSNRKILLSMIYGILLVLVVVFFNRYFYDGTEPFKSSLDGNDYRVRLGSNSQLKSDLLAYIYLKLNILVNTLKVDPKYTNNIAVQRLIHNWNRGVSIKEIGYMESRELLNGSVPS